MKKGASLATGVILLWLLGSSFVGLGLLVLLLSVGRNMMANLGVTFTLCLAPGAVLLALGWLATRARRSSPQAQAGQETGFPPFFRAPGRPETETTWARGVAGDPPVVAAGAAPLTYDPGKSAHKPAYYRERAAGYRRRIQSVIRTRRPGPLAAWLKGLVPKLERWEERVGQLVNRLTAFEGDDIIQRDIKEVPAEIARLSRLAVAESDPAVREQMERTLEGHQEHRDQLEALIRLMRRTRLQLDDTLASMGIIYSQVQLVDAADLDSTRAVQITEEIEEQASRLNDLLSAVSDVYEQPEDVNEAARRIRLERGQTSG